jgi:hypothetical protein
MLICLAALIELQGLFAAASGLVHRLLALRRRRHETGPVEAASAHVHERKRRGQGDKPPLNVLRWIDGYPSPAEPRSTTSRSPYMS